MLLATGAKVDRLIPLYAIGVFTSFTLSQAGMARHHIRHKEPGWRAGLFINGVGASYFVVDVIIAVTKFTHGVGHHRARPDLRRVLVRLNRQYTARPTSSSRRPRAAEAPILRRHVVLVFIDPSTSRRPARSSTHAR